MKIILSLSCAIRKTHTEICRCADMMSPYSQSSLSPDVIGYSSHHGNSKLDNLFATSCGNTTNLTSFDLNSVSVSDILSEVQASLDSDIVATSKDVTTSQCNPLTSVNRTKPSAHNVGTTLLSFGDITNYYSNLLGFTYHDVIITRGNQ